MSIFVSPDCTELTETRMQQSRRLIAVLPPGVSQYEGATASLCYAWHVGLHRALIEQQLRVILIQLEDMKDYSHLPLGLQHLLQKTPPLRWDERSGQATCPASRFWKQVRYMMPAPPGSRCWLLALWRHLYLKSFQFTIQETLSRLNCNVWLIFICIFF